MSVSRKLFPNNSPIVNFKINTPEQFILKSGIPVFFYNHNYLKLVKFTILNNFNPFENDPCINYFVKKMLLEGCEKYNHTEIADIIDFYGADMNITATTNANIISFTVLREYFNDIFELLCDILNSPSFEVDRLEYVKTKKIQELKIENTKNKTIAYKTFKKELLGNRNYGYSLNEEDIKKVKVYDLKNNFSQFWLNNTQIFITGDIDEKLLKDIDKNIPDNLNFSNDNFFNNKIESVNSSKIININKQDSEQVSMCLGHVLLNNEDSKKLWCTVAFLGGYFGSRLMKNIRERNGYTYGISAQIVNYRYVKYLLIKTSAKKEFKEAIIEEIRKEITLLQNEKISEEELNGFKQYFLGNMLATFSNVFSDMVHSVTVKMLSLEEDYYQKLFETIKNISGEEINHIAKKYLNPDKFVQVFVE